MDFEFKSLPQNWPNVPMVWLDQVFDHNTIDILKNIDIDKYGTVPFKGRKQYSYLPQHITDEPPEFADAMANIYKQFNSLEVLEFLISNAVANSTIKPGNVWINGMDDIRSLFKTCYLGIWEDSTNFVLGPHEDHRNILGVMMVYLSPKIGSSGTVFHMTGNFANAQKLPFEENTGFFLFNSPNSFHSAANNEKGEVRRSLNCVWVM